MDFGNQLPESPQFHYDRPRLTIFSSACSSMASLRP
jgi:hypothetical protein